MNPRKRGTLALLRARKKDLQRGLRALILRAFFAARFTSGVVFFDEGRAVSGRTNPGLVLPEPPGRLGREGAEEALP